MPAKPSKAKRDKIKRQQAEAARLAQEPPETDETEQDQSGDVQPVDFSIAGAQSGDGDPYGAERQVRTDTKLLHRALRKGWIRPDDLAPVRYDLDAPVSQVNAAIRQTGDPTTRQLMLRSVQAGMMSRDERSNRIAARTASLLEAANQKDEIERERAKRHADDMEIKRALLQMRGVHTDESIPTGVVLLSRPAVSMADWQAQVASDLAGESTE